MVNSLSIYVRETFNKKLIVIFTFLILIGLTNSISGLFFSYIAIIYLYKNKEKIQLTEYHKTTNIMLIILAISVVLGNLISSNYSAINNILTQYSGYKIIELTLGVIFLSLGTLLLRYKFKKILIPLIAIIIVHFIYHFVIFNTYKYQSNVYLELYQIFAEKDLAIKNCPNNTKCFKISKEEIKALGERNLEQNNQVSKGVGNYFLHLYTEINESTKDNVISNFIDQGFKLKNLDYKAFSVYNKKNNILILDFYNPQKIYAKNTEIYSKLLNIAMKLWIIFLFSTVWIHNKARGVKIAK